MLPVVPVELGVDVLRSEPRVRFLTIDLGSVYKIANADPVYWLVKADVLQRNNRQLIISVDFTSGLAGSVTSLRVTTKANSKTKRKGVCNLFEMSKMCVYKAGFMRLRHCVKVSIPL